MSNDNNVFGFDEVISYQDNGFGRWWNGRIGAHTLQVWVTPNSPIWFVEVHHPLKGIRRQSGEEGEVPEMIKTLTEFDGEF
jgi:hypothetical protein